jgi:Ca2+-binding RTX toxin-like protein
MTGSTGNDTYVVDATGDVVNETSTTATEIDSIQSSATYALGANVENLTLTGATMINGTGNALNNSITGNTANNQLDGSAGNDTMTGGTGNDTYVVDSTADVVNETSTLATEIDSVQSSVTYTLGSNLESLTLTGGNAINGTGNTLNNTLTGNTADNTLSGGTGSDTMTGDTGNDTYVVDNTGDMVNETSTMATEIDTINTSVSYTLGANVEKLTLTGTSTINGTGNALNNTIIGNTANNQLDGSTGDDTLIGGTGNDTYVVDNTGDMITETSTTATEIDTINTSVSYTLGANVEKLTLTGTSAINGTGNALNNTITGNTADNQLDGSTGNDTLIGGTGNDTYVVDATGDMITETSTTATEIETVNASVTYTLGSNLENLTLTGTGMINGTGNTLNNVLTGNTANNTLSGGTGNDSMTGDAGIDTLLGGAGNDIYTVDTATDTITENLNEGTDAISSSVTYTLGANVENLSLTGTIAINGTGNTLNNDLTGNSANNTLSGDTGIDTLVGGAGDDIYIVDTTTDTITENLNEGMDTISSNVTYTLGVNVENLTFTGTSVINGTGNSLNNTLTGNGGNNTLNAGDGNDTLIGDAGIDTLTGGTGDDTYIVDLATDTITENLNEGTDTISSSVTYTLGANVENLTLTGTSAINGTGNSLNNTLTGNGGNNTLNAGDGNDTLIGDAGIDTLIGGTGDDTYLVDTATDTITENLNEGTDTISSSVTYTLGANVENLTLTGNSAINGTGNSLNNVLTGNSGNNTFIGGAGIDTLIGGAGDDTYIVDTTTDTITENLNEGTDIVSSSVTYTLGANVENLSLTGTSAINGTGNTLNNALTGNSGNNILAGGEGNDTVDGGNGNDKLYGQKGADLLQGGIGNDYFSGLDGNDTVYGGDGDDSLNGGNENDRLEGELGNDTLIGSVGNDTMTGGAGSDRFIYDTNAVFTTSAVGIDRITDFVSGTDKIVLDKTTFTPLGSVVGGGFNLANEFAVVGSDAGAATVDALIVYSSETDNLFYNQNGMISGLGSGAQLATLTGIPTLAASDFVLQA